MGDGGGEVLSYHRLSMHRPERYAPGPGGLDWATQPAPFRQYRGCRQVELLHRPLEESPPYDGVFSGPAAAPSRLDRRSLSQMLYDGLALSAWKEAGGTRWALRVNPSSGNLHPTEAYLLLPGGTLEPAPLLAHYRPDKHALEVRGELPAPLASLLDDCLPAGGCLLALTSVPWREAWKYGERAYRYCQHDLGHALACLSIAAAIQGWEMRLLRGVAESALDGLFGLDRDGFAECESVDALFWIGPALTQEPSLSPRLCEGLAALPLAGAPNRLSREYRDWPELQRIHGLCRAPRLPARPWRVAPGVPGNDNPGLPLRPLLHRRRSAQRMDGRAGIDVELLRAWLRRLLPERSPVPFAVTGEAARVDLLLFVHRVRCSAVAVLARIWKINDAVEMAPEDAQPIEYQRKLTRRGLGFTQARSSQTGGIASASQHPKYLQALAGRTSEYPTRRRLAQVARLSCAPNRHGTPGSSLRTYHPVLAEGH